VAARVPAVSSAEVEVVRPAAAMPPAGNRRYDRSIVEGPLRRPVGNIAWPTMRTTLTGGRRGIIRHRPGAHLWKRAVRA